MHEITPHDFGPPWPDGYDPDEPWTEPEPPAGYSSSLPIHRTEANGGRVRGTCDGSGCPDCTDPA